MKKDNRDKTSAVSRRDFIRTGTVASMGLAFSGSFVLAEASGNTITEDNAGSLLFRQVHLDFHTSEHIPGVADSFDPVDFAQTLKDAAVNSVTCFARCCHGNIYYDSKKFPELKHPYLKRNLLKEQIDACHKQGIRVPIYEIVQWDVRIAREHPEWRVLDEKGHFVGTPANQPGFATPLCINSPYRDFLKERIGELFELFPVDGLFLDIVMIYECSCRYCRDGMKKEGLDVSSPEDRWQYAFRVNNEFKADITRFIHSKDKNCPVFFNTGHVGPYIKESLENYSHLELESLPSGGWGYMHFPLTARYARTLGKDYLGMTGKFHTSWGDFHSFKNQAALQYECFMMLALGAKCSVGDQLLPNGRIDPATYDLIGSVYREVEKKEPWCEKATPLADVAVLNTEEFTTGTNQVSMPQGLMGAVRMLQEGHQQFNIVDSRADWSSYKVLILPDDIPVDSRLNEKLANFIELGGAVIASFRSGLTPEGDKFALNQAGIRKIGPAPFSPDFIVPGEKVAAGLPQTEHVMYQQAIETEAFPGTEILAQVYVPYFNRTVDHFCSHRHTPSAGKPAYPAITKKDRIIYFAHPVFTQYNDNAPLWCKKLFLNALAMLLPNPSIRVKGPSTMAVALNSQKHKNNRQIVHFLHYVPERRGRAIDIIEDIIPLYNIEVDVSAEKRPGKVLLAPQGKTIPYKWSDGRVSFTVPEIYGHQMICIE